MTDIGKRTTKLVRIEAHLRGKNAVDDKVEARAEELEKLGTTTEQVMRRTSPKEPITMHRAPTPRLARAHASSKPPSPKSSYVSPPACVPDLFTFPS